MDKIPLEHKQLRTPHISKESIYSDQNKMNSLIQRNYYYARSLHIFIHL